MSWKKRLLLYVVLPAVVCLALVGAYFSGLPWLQSIIAPSIPGVSTGASREIGLLENVENACLLGIIFVAACGVWRKKLALERVGFVFLLVFSIWVFLEEVDYGWNWREVLFGQQPTSFRNIHNVGDTTQMIKSVVDLSLVLLFAVAPVAARWIRWPLFRYAAPSAYSILTLVVMVLVRSLAHGFESRGYGHGGALTNNVSEFRELVVYYVFLLYMAEIVFLRSPLRRAGLDAAWYRLTFDEPASA